MSSSSDPGARSSVLRGNSSAARPAFLDIELARGPAVCVMPSSAATVDPAVDEAFTAGYDNGYAEGHDQGKAAGYADGYQSGTADATAAARDRDREREASVRRAIDALTAAAAACIERQAVALADIEDQVV